MPTASAASSRKSASSISAIAAASLILSRCSVATMADGKLDQETIDRWRADPCAFVEEALADPEVGTAYRLLPAERAFLAHAFQTDASGRLRYPEQVYARPQEGGKTAFPGIAAL